jgi:two-component system cell cycle sensor histidine kinase/response regulator CckA
MSGEGTILGLSQPPGGFSWPEELSDLLFQHATTGLAIADPGGRLLRVNPALCRLLGLHEDQLVNQLFETWLPPDDVGRARDLFALAGRRGTRPGPAPWSLRRADGRWLSVLIGADGITLRDGRSVVVTFVTDLEPHPELLPPTERSLIQAVDGIFWEVETPSFRCTYVSPQIQRILGFAPSAWLADPTFWAKQLHPDDRAAALAFCLSQTEQLLDHELDYRMLAADGRVVWMHDRVHVVAAEGRPVRLQGVMVDITARKALAAEQELLQQQLQRAQRHESIALLAGGIAHDFNNLLTGILGFTSLARAEVPGGAPAADYLDQVEQSTRRAADLCRQMLAYAGRGKVIVEPVDLNPLLRDLEPLLRALVPPAVALRFDLADDLPRVSADASQLRQLVLNLVTNAGDALPDRSGTITLRTGQGDFPPLATVAPLRAEGTPPAGPAVWLRVEDTGTGIAPEIRDRIFDPFFTTRFVGRGLGLSAVLGIVRAHRGALTVESTPGRGSAFAVFLPGQPTPTPTAAEPVAATPLPSTEPRTVLVIEDEAAVRTFLTLLLERLGYRVLQASDGDEGLAVFAQHRQEVWAVLLDLTMPRLGGRETLAELLQQRPGLPVVLMSGYSVEEVNTRLSGQRIAGFLQKPFTPALVQAILAAIG